MDPERIYALHPACRVRPEDFGLLFYDARGPRLLFAATGSLLPPEFFRGQQPLGSLLESVPVPRRESIRGLCLRLLEKGFLREQPLC